MLLLGHKIVYSKRITYSSFLVEYIRHIIIEILKFIKF